MAREVPLLDLTGRKEITQLPEDIGFRAPQLVALTLAGGPETAAG